MLCAVIGAINGDAEGLRRALHAVEEEGILTLVHTGDAAVGGAGLNEVIALLRERGWPCVQGERDRELVRVARKPHTWRARLDEEAFQALASARDAITSEHLEWLNQLPRKRRLEVDDASIVLCHGSPAAQADFISPETPVKKLERYRELAPADILICGGASASFSRRIGETLLCGIGPLRGPQDEVRVCVVSTETETPVMHELLA